MAGYTYQTTAAEDATLVWLLAAQMALPAVAPRATVPTTQSVLTQLITLVLAGWTLTRLSEERTRLAGLLAVADEQTMRQLSRVFAR